jgi:hypothetical protein
MNTPRPLQECPALKRNEGDRLAPFVEELIVAAAFVAV